MNAFELNQTSLGSPGRIFIICLADSSCPLGNLEFACIISSLVPLCIEISHRKAAMPQQRVNMEQ